MLRAASIRTAAIDRQQRVLLLLDTFDRLHDADQLVGPASAIGLAQRADPDLVVLATSRARLALRFERVLPLTGLGVHPGGPAVQMFRERSKAVGGDLGEIGQDAAIAAVCRQLRGVPLAIELAAGRTTLLPPAALLARMGSAEPADLLGVLANGPVDAPARHRSIRAATAWSYQLLRTREQALLRRLGVFTGSFNLHAAESVCVGVTAGGRQPELANRFSTRSARSSSCTWSSPPAAIRNCPGSPCWRPPGRTRPNCWRCPANSTTCAPGCTTGAWTSPNAPGAGWPPRRSGAGSTWSRRSYRPSGRPWPRSRSRPTPFAGSRWSRPSPISGSNADRSARR